MKGQWAVIVAAGWMFGWGCAGSPAVDRVSRAFLVESVPIETDLGSERLPDAHEVWPALLSSAERSIDWAAFYVSDEPPSRLTPVLEALHLAAARGVRVRLLADAGFYSTYPTHLDHLDSLGVDVRLVDFDDGGAMHAKYFVVDDEALFVGSQNTDWRALEHIYELGLWTDDADAVRAFADAFLLDWDVAAPIGEPEPRRPLAGRSDEDTPPSWAGRAIDSSAIAATMSPSDRLPDGATWDLDELRQLIDGATSSVRLSLLSYRVSDRSGAVWTPLRDALVRAGERGVRVDVLLADWGKRPTMVDDAKALQRAAGIEVRFVTFPEASSGFIPFARVSHAKYLIADERAFWLGTSNWSRRYFHSGRNLGVIVRDEALALEVSRSFGQVWTSPYAETVDPERSYTPPRIGE